MNKVMICKELLLNKEDTKSEIRYYKVPEEWKEGIVEKRFIFIVNKETEKQNISIFQIIKTENFVNFNQQNNITILSENEKIYLVSEDFLFNQSIKIVKEYYNYTIEELRKFFNILIKDLKCKISDARKKPPHNKRTKYLLKMFSDKSFDEFCKSPESYKNEWFNTFSNYELDHIHTINLYYIKQTISQLIEMNKIISNIDKKSLKGEYLNKLEMISSSIILKGHARYQIGGSIGIDTSSDGKCLVLGKMSSWEAHIRFVTIWNSIKNLLTVSFIPILIVLVGSDEKIIIYCLLAIVYIITLILSDEKQTDHVIIFINQIKWNKERKTNYATLFYLGLAVVFAFIIFSIQIVNLPSIVKSVRNFVMYLAGDILLAHTTLFLLLILGSVFFWLITVIPSTIFYIKRAEKFNTVFSFCFKTAFWILSDYCLFYTLEINKYFYSSQPLEWRFLVFWMALMISLLKIAQNIVEFRKR